ncbi:MAG TPA: ABC transporter substrate-binding protein [Methanotrichaceae archaeon]|nr:ABC transporter substrate-binding protein [Methanotrichaceae archaeon]HQF17152.1 ABC transporter substrate-binding protein [Methanotrichaceae archaeon]
MADITENAWHIQIHFLLVILLVLPCMASPISAGSYTLGIFGNANMDDTIDEQDIEYVRGIIVGIKEETELADANCDGKIDERDITQIRQMMNGDDMEVAFLDSDNKAVSVKKPVKRLIVLGTSHAEVLRSLNCNKKIVGVSTYVTDKQDFHPEMMDLPTVGSGWTPDYEAIIGLDPDIILQYSGWTPEMEDNLKDTGIAVARIGLKMDNYTSEIARLGYVLDAEDSAKEVIDFHDGCMKTIRDRVGNLSEDKKPKVFLEWSLDYQTDPNSSLHQLCKMAGGLNIAADIPGKNPTVDAEWIMTKDPDIIVKYPFRKTADHGYTTNNSSEMETLRENIISRPGFANITAVKEGGVFVMGQEIVSGPRALVAVAYMAKWFHPDLFKDLDPKAIHQEYLTRFQGLDYDLDKQGVFVYPPLEER